MPRKLHHIHTTKLNPNQFCARRTTALVLPAILQFQIQPNPKCLDKANSVTTNQQYNGILFGSWTRLDL